jgi:hypothetical protein
MRSKANIGRKQYGGLYRMGRGAARHAEIARVEPAFKELK